MIYTVLFFVLSMLWTCTLSDSCTTPLGKASNCISLYDCPQFIAAFNQQPLSSQTINFLRRSQCGFEGNTPIVCCGPIPSFSQDPPTPTRGSPRPARPDPIVDTDNSSEDSVPAPRGECGLDESDRIYGGQITDLDEFPWMVLLGYQKRDRSITYQCGGVLINHRYVMTAAHCVVGQVLVEVGTLVTVRLGEYDLQQEIDCLDGTCADPPQEIAVEKAYAHSGYSDRNINRKDDIALVRLAARARYTFYVRPICLFDAGARLDVGNAVYVSGWGKTLNGKNSPVKLKLSVPVFAKNECEDKYRTLNAELTDKQLCAGGNFAQDTCRGDSGGPLMRRRADGTWESVGIVSFGYGCGRDGWPGVYTSVESYDDWIRSKLRTTNV